MGDTSHTRLPRYARGKFGIIERDHGVFVFPDSNAQGLGGQLLGALCCARPLGRACKSERRRQYRHVGRVC